jgi:hypothetical protein
MQELADTPALGRSSLKAALDSHDWLRVGIKALVLLYVLILGYAFMRSPDLANFLGLDFLTFWAASHLTLGGDATAPFDPVQLRAAAQVALPALDRPLLWHYPPTFQLIALPLALIPYVPASIAWLAATFLAYIGAMRRLVSHRDLLLLIAAFPAVVVNLRVGQNGFLSAALLAGAIAFLRTRPAVAGVLIGLLSYKPHLGLLIPLALLCGRQWTALFAAALTVVAFTAASAAILGLDTWPTFFNSLTEIGQRLDDGTIKWRMIPSVYIGLRIAGLDTGAAYAAHIAAAAFATLSVVWAWLRRVPFELAAAVLVSATVLVPPYIFDYDLTLLAIPIMILVSDGARRGWLAGERVVLALAWFSPILHTLNLQKYGISLEPLCLIALLVIALRRAVVFADEYGASTYDRRLRSTRHQPATS